MTCSIYTHKIKSLNGDVIGNALIANTWWLRLRGLLGRKLEDQEGILITPCNSVHMVGMKYPIDIVYLNKENAIVKITENLRPWQFSACRQAHKVLELSTKNSETKTLKVGDTLRFELMREI